MLRWAQGPLIYDSTIHNRKARLAARRAAAIAQAQRVLHEVVAGSLDEYEGYRRVYGIYLSCDGLAQ